MKTIIDSCGSKWKGDTPNTVAQLLALLAVEPLDPQFEDFGNFINTNPMAARDGGYGPDGKRLYIETGPCYPDMPGCVEFWGNFYAVSHVFKIVSTDPAVIEQMTAAIRANQATPAYAQAKRERNEKAIAEQRRYRRA